jgi:hypothetical protein
MPFSPAAGTHDMESQAANAIIIHKQSDHPGKFVQR